jgi:hypothetical protein
MTDHKNEFLRAVRRLTDALRRETVLARAGALYELALAAAEKRAAFESFCEIQDNGDPDAIENRAAVQVLVAEANESALVLEAVQDTLQSTAERLRELAATVADPGVYAPFRRAARHVAAAQIDATA